VSVEEQESEFCYFIEAEVAGTEGHCEGQDIFHVAFHSAAFMQ